jgi:hypothetical protein
LKVGKKPDDQSSLDLGRSFLKLGDAGEHGGARTAEPDPFSVKEGGLYQQQVLA